MSLLYRIVFIPCPHDAVNCRRIHISAATKDYLDDQFELEDGHGESREDALRLAGVSKN